MPLWQIDLAADVRHALQRHDERHRPVLLVVDQDDAKGGIRATLSTRDDRQVSFQSARSDAQTAVGVAAKIPLLERFGRGEAGRPVAHRRRCRATVVHGPVRGGGRRETKPGVRSSGFALLERGASGRCSIGVRAWLGSHPEEQAPWNPSKSRQEATMNGR